jgi:hypothetical protein
MYQYFFATLKIYAAFTLHITAWGTRDASAFVKVEEPKADDEASISTVANAAKAAKTRNQIAFKNYRKGNVAFMRRVHSQAYDDGAPDVRFHSSNAQLYPQYRAVPSNVLYDILPTNVLYDNVIDILKGHLPEHTSWLACIGATLALLGNAVPHWQACVCEGCKLCRMMCT